MVLEQALSLPRFRILNRLAFYAREMVHQVHLKLRLANLVCGMLPDFGSGVLRTRMYRLIGMHIGGGSSIAGNIEFVGGLPGFYQKIRIGSGANIANRVTISLDAEVRMGNNVSLGPYVKIYTGTHPIGPGSNRRGPEVLAKPVVIEDGSWIGLGAIILPGVTVGHGSIVAAGAMVDEDVPPDSYVAGNPAKVVQQLPWGNR
jgi:acetyltransferase-like isoleucine patch superfamily enzyme